MPYKNPEDRKRYLEKNRERFLEQSRAYHARPEVLERKKAYHKINKEKVSLRKKLDRESNPEKFRLRSATYRSRNKEKIRAQAHIYQIKNREKIAAKVRAYRKASPEKYAAIAARRRARKLNTVNDESADNFYEFVGQNKLFKCYYCKKTIKRCDMHVDHIIPLAKGGKHIESNLCTSCAECNQRKNATLPSEIRFIDQSLLNL